MKWKTILVMALSMALLVSRVQAQRIVQSDYNAFTGERNIETSIVSLKSGFSNGFGIAFRAYKNNIYLTFVGYGKKNGAVAEDDRLQFILADGNIIKFDLRVQLPSNESSVPNLYLHHYFISKKEVEALLAQSVVIVRVVSANAYNDLPIARRNARDLVNICSLFLKEMNKF